MFTYSCPKCKKTFQKGDVFLMCSDCGFQFSTVRLQNQILTAKIFQIIKSLVITCVVLAIFITPIVVFPKLCKVGTVTENGGIIFYDKMHYSNGWRYLEVAPKTIFATTWASLENSKIKDELIIGLGNGDRNSYTIINRFGSKSASYKALSYGDDWYLGTCEEMKILNMFLKSNLFKKKIASVEGFEPLDQIEESNENKPKEPIYYWTSELYNLNYAYAFNFSEKNVKPKALAIYTKKVGDRDVKAQKCFVRPIRKF